MRKGGLSGRLCAAVPLAHLGKHMYGSTLRRSLSLGALAVASLLAQPIAAQQCADPWPNFAVIPDEDGIVYTGDSLVASIQPEQGSVLTGVTVTVNGATAITQTTFPPPGADGRVVVKYELIVDADKPKAIRLPPSDTPMLKIRATDSRNNCAQSVDVRVRTRSPKMFAVVVGINEYPRAQASLSFARKDAEAVAHHLIHNLKVNPANVFLLTDAVPPGEVDQFPARNRATRASIVRAMINIASRVDKAGSIVFYYSGHGFATEKTGFRRSHFMLTEDSALTDDVDMLSMSEIIDRMNTSPGDQKVIIVDACFSDGIVTGYDNPADNGYRAGRAFGPVSVLSDVSELIGHQNNDSVFVMTSSSADQLSYEFDDLKHGAFTYYLLESAQTPHAADVTIDHAYTFAATSVETLVKRVLDKEQKPRQWRVGTADQMVWKRRPP